MKIQVMRLYRSMNIMKRGLFQQRIGALVNCWWLCIPEAAMTDHALLKIWGRKVKVVGGGKKVSLGAEYTPLQSDLGWWLNLRIAFDLPVVNILVHPNDHNAWLFQLQLIMLQSHIETNNWGEFYPGGTTKWATLTDLQTHRDLQIA